MADHDIFVSYRREGGENLAGRIKDALENKGYSVFMDVEDLKSGRFDDALYKKIEESTDVIVILTAGCLERCSNEDDWLRNEIRYAIKCKRNIVPVIGRGFQMPPPEALPADIADLVKYNGLASSHDLFDATIDKLSEFLKSTARNRVASVNKLNSRTGYIFGGALVIVISFIIAFIVKPSAHYTDVRTDSPAPVKADKTPESKPMSAPPPQKAEQPGPLPGEVDYHRLASPAFCRQFVGKTVNFRAMFLSEDDVVPLYSFAGITTENRIFINHRNTDYAATNSPLGSSDLATPPFPLSVSTNKADFIYSLHKGDIIIVKGQVEPARPKYQLAGAYPKINIHATEVKKINGD